MKDDLEVARQWLAKAANDLLNADNNLEAENIPLDTVCFHCQQAAEKILKATLAAGGRAYPFTHDLLLLLEKVLEIDNGAERLRNDLSLLMPYAVEIRYPDDWFLPSLQDAREARAAAGRVLIWMKRGNPELFSQGL